MSAFTLGPALLFCPADRPERYAKAAERADAVIIDLEDAVAPADKHAARAALRDAQHTTGLDPRRVIVRVNPIGSPDHDADLAAVTASPFRTLMIAKAESAEALAALPTGFDVIALCETARGIVEAERIAAVDRVVALMWGPEDLVASLGGTSSRYPDGTFRDVARHARARMLLACGAFGKAAIDTVHLDIADAEGLRAEALDAVASGFTATACIHPSQVATVREAYRPTAAEIARAERIIAAAATERGVFALDGQMVDEPVLRHARAVLHRAG